MPLADWVADENYRPEDTDQTKDFEKNQFLDLRRPLICQVWEANFRRVLSFHFFYGGSDTLNSKNYYLKQVHQPRHLADSPRLFGPWYLEVRRIHDRITTNMPI